MKRFYLFLGLLCTTTGASYAVQNNQYARVSTTKQTTGISETKKSILPTKKNTDTPVLSAVVRSGTGTLGSLSANNDEQRLSLSNKTGLNKKIVQPGNSYKIPVPANIQQPESVKVSALEKQIEELQAVVYTMDSKIAQAKQEAKDAAVQDAKKEIADEKKVIEQNIKTAKDEAVAAAANNAAENFVKTKDIDSKVNAALETKKVLTADSETLNDFVKTKDFTEEKAKIQKDIENAKTVAKDETIAIVDKNFVTNVDKVLETKQFLTSDALKDYAKEGDLKDLASNVDANKANIDDNKNNIEKYKNELWAQVNQNKDNIASNKDDTSSAIANLNDSMKDFITSDALKDYAKEGDLKDLAFKVEANNANIADNKNNIEKYKNELWAQVNQNKDNIASNKDYADSAIANLNDSMKDFITSDALKDYATKEGDLKDLASNVDANKANIDDNKNNIEKYKNELWAQVNKNKDEIASNKDDTGSAIANLTTTITQNKTETDAAVAAAIATAKDYSNNATGELWTQVNANTNLFANYATTASLGDYAKTSDLNNYATTASLGDYAKTSDLNNYATTASLGDYAKTSDLNNYATTASLSDYATISDLSGYATTASLEDIQTDIDDMVEILSSTTDEAMKNSPKFNTVMTNHNIAVGIYEGDDKPKTNP